MNKQKIGILNPGNMGIAVAASIQNTGHTVYWVSENRGPNTHKRAEEFGLQDAKNLKKLCETCSAIVSVCPPHAAEAVANQVSALGFGGLYIDVNALSPDRTKQIAQVIQKTGGTFVDGGIIGSPPKEREKTWLYLSGSKAKSGQRLFSAVILITSLG